MVLVRFMLQEKAIIKLHSKKLVGKNKKKVGLKGLLNDV